MQRLEAAGILDRVRLLGPLGQHRTYATAGQLMLGIELPLLVF